MSATVDSKTRSPILSAFRRNRVGMAAAIFVGVLILIAVFADALAPQDPNAQELLGRVQGPSGEHLLGTDGFGRDNLSRLIVATRVTLWATAQGVGIAVLLGIPLGLIAGYMGGLVDGLLSRIADALLGFPALLLAVAVVGVLGTGLTNVMMAIGLVFSPRFFRVARAAALSVREETYIEAAEAAGCGRLRVLWRHVLPNASGPLLVQSAFSLGYVITAEAGLSFIGLGVQPPTSSWGTMTREAYETISNGAFGLIPPITMIVLTVLAFSVIGDGLRDAIAGTDRRRDS